MIRTILIPTSGSETDQNVFQTALAVARGLPSHLDFYHVWIGAGEAACYTPHADFVVGKATVNMLRTLDAKADTRAANAKLHFAALCAQEHIPISDCFEPVGGLSAGWCIEVDNARDRLISRARHRDLIVLGRAHQSDGLPRDLLELLVLGCGRPILIAPDGKVPKAMDTVFVCWKETPEAARAVAAAMPLLLEAKRIIVANVEEEKDFSESPLGPLVDELAWHGIRAEILSIAATGQPVSDLLFDNAREQAADLVVAGAYGHGRTRELFFGGVTDTALTQAELPILLMH